MPWWLWALGGLALLALEMATPGGFFAVFFGLAALAVSALAGAGLAGPAWAQWLAFTALSILGVAVFRRPVMRWLKLGGPGQAVDSLAQESAVVTEAVPAQGVGKAEMRGSSWSARSASGAALEPGQRCRVERVEGLTLWLRPE
jgi:membrane protein implicated in regulation of membrane protease activity